MKKLLYFPRCALALAVFTLPAALYSVTPTSNQTISPTAPVPRETAVLLLPALDMTPDRENMQAPRRSVIRHREQVEFITRAFKVLGENFAAKASESNPILDLAHESSRTPEKLDELAARTQTDWVVNIVVQTVEMNPAKGGDLRADTRVLSQVWDARQHKWLLNVTYTGHASGSGSPALVFMQSLDDATMGALASCLAQYPRVVTLEGENSLRDYLEGQSEPLAADFHEASAGTIHVK